MRGRRDRADPSASRRRGTRQLEREEPTISAGVLVAEPAASDEAPTLDAVRELLLAGREPAERDLARLLAAEAGLPVVDLRTCEIDPEVSRLLPRRFCRRFAVLPIGFDDGVLVVGVAHPSNDVAIDAARGMLRREIRLVVVARSDLFAAMERLDEPTSVVTPPRQPAMREEPASKPAPSPRGRPILRPLPAVAAAVLLASTGLAAVLVTRGGSGGEALASAARPRSQAAPSTTRPRTTPTAPAAAGGEPGRTFAWVPVPGASSYAFELDANSKPIFTAHTSETRFTLPSAWTFRGRRFRLEPGLHRWQVWALDAAGERRDLVVNASLVVPG